MRLEQLNLIHKKKKKFLLSSWVRDPLLSSELWYLYDAHGLEAIFSHCVTYSSCGFIVMSFGVVFPRGSETRAGVYLQNRVSESFLSRGEIGLVGLVLWASHV